MRCIIVRHGKAEPASGRDEDRALTDRGRRQAEFVGRSIAESGGRPALILASRFERAIHTARIIQGIVDAPLRTVPDLEVGCACSVGLALIEGHGSFSPLMLVGHNPQLSELVWALVHGVPAGQIGLRTGEAVELELLGPGMIGTASELSRLRLPGND